jgi:hypothetical protein
MLQNWLKRFIYNTIYKWVTFKELRGLTREQFADELGKACLYGLMIPLVLELSIRAIESGTQLLVK